MEKIIGIYKITSPSEKVYIGQSKNILFRWNYHYKKYHCKKQRHLYNSLIKYGYDNHIFEILEVCEIECLDKAEIYYIEKYDATNKDVGLNHRAGGNGKITSQETKELMRQRAIGNTNMLGKHHSIESKELIRKKKTGVKLSEFTRKKMSDTRKGYKHSEETKDKLSKANKFTRKIKNIKTGNMYDSITRAALIESISQSTIYRGLKDGRYEYV